MPAMKFVIKPADSSFEMMLEANQYRRIWEQHQTAILEAFRALTGLEFQQHLITARVTRGSYGHAGLPGRAMILPGDFSSVELKTCTLVHELAHRLLGGNALGIVALGLVPNEDIPDPRYQKFEHRHSYLFQKDVIERAFGAELAQICVRSEQSTNSADYKDAWDWAMSMDFSQRQRAVERLTALAIPREKWQDMDDNHDPAPRDPDEWYASLAQN
ncbi:MAG: hypothetical protein JWM81_652 [Candidatus Saccharibacteria bacterium]|nr:hypothetical protein [Candidatus Saccharibacteria bacterium]